MDLPSVVLLAAGTALVLVGLTDVVVTVLHPSRQGVLAAAIDRAVFAVAGGVARRRRPGLLPSVGPLALALTFVAWLTMIGIGFALVYLAWAERIAYSGPGPAPRDLAAALYLSGAALSTVGFGDVVAGSDALRLVTVVESAAGLTVLTATVTYLLTAYSVVTDLRAGATHAHDLGAVDPARATALLLHSGPSGIARLQRDLIVTQQHLRRFPGLRIFHPERPEESLYTLLRAALTMDLVLRFGVDRDELPFAEEHGRAFGLTVERILDGLRVPRAGGPGPVDVPDAPGAAARAALAALHRAIESVRPGLAADPATVDLAALHRTLTEGETMLARLAAAHRYPHAPLLAAT